MKEGFYTTGEFARMGGVTIRTIRYYDTKGILKPSHYTEAGHRLYSYEDFIKLKKILALKYLGLSLEEVINTEKYNFKKDDLEKSLKLQKNIIKNKINHMKIVLNAIEMAELSIKAEDDLDWNKTIDIIKILESEKELLQQYVDASNLNASIELKDRFSSNKQGWYQWTFSKMNLKKECKVLEIGCGNGALWSRNIEYLSEGIDITLTDICEDMINEARDNLSQYNKKIDFQIADPTNLPYKHESFDIVIANHILFYMKDISTVLEEVKRILKVGGYFYCSTISKTHMKELEEIIIKFNGNITNSQEKLSDKFGLENGEEILNSHFSNINKYMYEDKLIVNDAKAILVYIYSMPGNILEVIDNKKREFEIYIDKKIRHKSQIYITENSGLFESIKI